MLKKAIIGAVTGAIAGFFYAAHLQQLQADPYSYPIGFGLIGAVVFLFIPKSFFERPKD